MSIRRIVTDLSVTEMKAAQDFYVEALGMRVAMDQGWVVTLVDGLDASRQITLTTQDASAPVNPSVSIEVDDVDAAYAACQSRGDELVHPLTDEPWGVRRFFVRDPSGAVINILGHL